MKLYNKFGNLIIEDNSCNTMRELLEKYKNEVSFENANLYQSNLQGANLQNVNLYNSDISHSKLYLCDLSNSNLTNVDLSYSNLTFLNLNNTILTNCNMHGAYFNNGDIKINSIVNLNDILPKYHKIYIKPHTDNSFKKIINVLYYLNLLNTTEKGNL